MLVAGLISQKFEVKPEEPSEYPKFPDVIGLEETKDDLKEIIACIKNNKKYEQMGAKMVRGILLTGPPGTGKTFIAKALANECGANFYYKSGSEIQSMYVGVSAQNIKRLFKEAKKNGPAIIFIDEIDSIGGKRDSQINYGSEGGTFFRYQIWAIFGKISYSIRS